MAKSAFSKFKWVFIKPIIQKVDSKIIGFFYGGKHENEIYNFEFGSIAHIE